MLSPAKRRQIVSPMAYLGLPLGPDSAKCMNAFPFSPYNTPYLEGQIVFTPERFPTLQHSIY